MKVLVAIDESDGSFHALRWALENLFHVAQPEELLDQNTNSITLVNVQQTFQPFIYPAGPVMYTTPMMITDDVRKAQEQYAANILARAMHVCMENKVKAETLVLQGDPKDKICEAAEDLHVDLVVVGSRGLGMIKRAFLGSVSNYCAHHVHCPIVIVKPPPTSTHDD